MYGKHMVFRRHETVSNLAKGLWFDVDNRDIIVEDCLISNNLTDGIWSEINPDGVTFRDCVISNNQYTGVVIANSEHLIIENNKIFGNNWQQLGMWEPDEYRDIGDDFLDLVTHNLVLKNNWIASDTSSEKLVKWEGWSGLYSTMDSQNNKWYRPGTRNGFYVANSNKTWTQWQALVPQDTTSVYLYSAPDLNPPTPNPLSWQQEPTASGSTSITMIAETAMDSGGVEYYFCNLTDPTHDSGWQNSSTYHDTGLVPGRKYFYRVRARDTSDALNETWWSVPACATTLDTAIE
jgi:parallel beta-helix repeat protein